MKVSSTPAGGVYRFGPFRLDLGRQELLRGGEPVPLTPKAFDTLRVLVEADGAVVPKEELLALVWRDRFVEESVLSQNVYTLRKILAEGDEGRSYILTVPRRGYRLAVPVDRWAETSEATTAEQPAPPPPLAGPAAGLADGFVERRKTAPVAVTLPAAPPPEAARRRPLRLVLAGAAALVLVAAVLLAVAARSRPRPEPPGSLRV
ncbi:MAG TPA: transcriptional regulator, partial [Thermoanaerobaculia bacterium]|nr:transcriptional regulator [Thermoanaerobaculia bacterium]